MTYKRRKIGEGMDSVAPSQTLEDLGFDPKEGNGEKGL